MAPSFMESGHWLVAGWTMLHFLWVGGVIGLIAGAGRLILGSARPDVRYGLALTCLAALTAAPLVIALIVTAQGAPQLVPSGFDAAPWPRDPAVNEPGLASDQTAIVVSPPAAAGADSQVLTGFMSALSTAARYLPWAWLIGAPLVFAMAATGLAGAERLRGQSRLLNRGTAPALCQRLLQSLGMSQRVTVGMCHRITSPVLVGILRPMILLPPAALMGWTTDQLEMVLLHELAHVRRWDNLVNLLQRIVEALLFFHPAVWLVSRWVRTEREHCCDQEVLTYTQRPRAYAEMLAAMVSPAPGRLAVVAMGEANVVTRIRRVLKLENEGMKLSQKLVGLLMSVFVAGAMLIGASARQSAAAAHRTEGNSVSFSANPQPLTLQPGSEHLAGEALAQDKGASTPASARITEAGATTTDRTFRLPADQQPQDTVVLRLIDSDGRPVNGANIALRNRWKQGKPEFILRRGDPQDLKSDEDGRVTLPWAWFRKQMSPAGIPVLAMNAERGISGVVMISNASRGHELTVRLQPACRVRFRLDSPGLRDMGYPMIQAKGHIMVQGYDELPLFDQTIDQSSPTGEPYDFEYLLPPGKYSTWAFGDADGRPETLHVMIPFEVKEGQTELDLGTIDLPPTRYSLYYGQPAPEFIAVKNARSNTPLRLADLRGKVVAVCFVETFSSCMTDCLRELSKMYKQNGLEVVILRSPDLKSFPADRAASSSELQPWWQAGSNAEPVPAEEDGAGGPLIEAVDSGGWTPVEGSTRKVLGATAAAYGLENPGLLLLIDREGRLLQRLRLERPVTTEVLERALGLRQ